MSVTDNRSEFRRRNKQRLWGSVCLILVVVLAAGAIIGGGYYYFAIIKPERDAQKNKETTAVAGTTAPSPSQSDVNIGAETTGTGTETGSEELPTVSPISSDDTLKAAARYAAMYDYDKAIELLRSSDQYSTDAYRLAEADYLAAKQSLVKWPDNTKICHLFFHTLVADPDITFYIPSAYQISQFNSVMTTMDEFKKILQQMYDRGFVLVTPYDMATLKTAEDGSLQMTANPIYLPAGKTPVVFSQDDVCYYEYMTGLGFATKLVVTDDGRVRNEYVFPDGTVSIGAYDMVPVLDDFIEEHPDFSYKGAKGILALTGYNGVLGYRTSEYSYGAGSFDNVDFVRVNPNIEQDRIEAKKVADALKEDGWLFASHSWGHRRYGQISYEDLVVDANRWEAEVVPIIGETDLMIFAFGDDIGSWRGYDVTNERYTFLRSLGFNYYFNVDSNQPWVQISKGTGYLRQGRSNADGYRMYEAITSKDRLEQFFDSKEVFDERRPTPVTQ